MVVFIVFEGRGIIVFNVVAVIFYMTMAAYTGLTTGGKMGFDIYLCSTYLTFFPVADIVITE